MFDRLVWYDIQLLNLIRSIVPSDNQMLVKMISFFSDIWVFYVAIFLVSYWIIWTFKKDDNYKKLSLYIFYTIIFSFVIYTVLNQTLPPRVRPEMVSTIPPLISHIPDNSFPSWHALFSWASLTAFYIFLTRRKHFFILLFLCALMLLSRIIAWIHYPADIAAWVLLWIILWNFFVYFRYKPFFKDTLTKYPIKLAKLIKL